MPKADPNLRDRRYKALTVACPYCKAKAGQQCWTLRHRKQTEHEYYDATQEPHKARIRASWNFKGVLNSPRATPS